MVAHFVAYEFILRVFLDFFSLNLTLQSGSLNLYMFIVLNFSNDFTYECRNFSESQLIKPFIYIFLYIINSTLKVWGSIIWNIFITQYIINMNP